ncbi:MAG: galactokinase, partial [Chloroflexi bacterium]|nr:galactokinase [Chloroflexota bacterium]
MAADTANLARAFAAQHGREPRFIAEAPGRVNLIGEHTDYNDGFVLPIAIDRTIAVAAAARKDNRVLAHSVDHDQRDDFSLDNARRHPMGGWRNYVRGVLWALLDSQRPLSGVDLSISGDVPQGAGLSSSAALELALAGAICAASGVTLPPRDLALLCQRAEQMYAGVQCGIMDQFAAALGREGRALFIDCRSLETEDVPLPDGIAIVVIDSKVPRDLAGTPYNRRGEECAEAARALGLASLRSATETQIESLPDDLRRRARHVVTENARVLDATAALRDGDRETLGRLFAESHASLRDGFEASTPEIDLLVELANATPGAIGARLTGGGFGGCTVNLVEAAQAQRFGEAVVSQYRQRTGLDGEAHVCRTANGMQVRDA